MSSKSDRLKARQRRQTKRGWKNLEQSVGQVGKFIGWLGFADKLAHRLAEEEPEPYNPHTSVSQAGPQGSVPASKPKSPPALSASKVIIDLPQQRSIPITPPGPPRTLNELKAAMGSGKTLPGASKPDPTMDLFDLEDELAEDEEEEELDDLLSNMGRPTEPLGTAFSGASPPKSTPTGPRRSTPASGPTPEPTKPSSPGNPFGSPPQKPEPPERRPEPPPPAEPVQKNTGGGDGGPGNLDDNLDPQSHGSAHGGAGGRPQHTGGLITDGDPSTHGPMRVVVQEGECWVPPDAVKGMGVDLLHTLNSLGTRDPQTAARANAGLVELLGNHGPLSDDQLILLHQDDTCRDPNHPERHQAFAARMREHRLVHGRDDGPFLEKGGEFHGNNPRQNGEDVPGALPEGGFVLNREATDRFHPNVLARLTAASLVDDHWTVDAARRVVANAMGIDLPPTDAEIDALMADPRYWRDRDPATVQQVRDGIRHLCDGRKRAREPFGTNRQHQ